MTMLLQDTPAPPQPSTPAEGMTASIDPSRQYQVPLPTWLRVPLLRRMGQPGDLWSAVAAIVRNGASSDRLIELARATFGVKHVVPMAGGSTVLRVGLQALGLGDGDEVIVQSMMCRGPAQAILDAGCQPVLADVGDDYNLDPDSVEACISPRTRAIVMANMFGCMADVDRLTEIARRHGVYLIDDAAVSAGASHGGRMSGTFGRFGMVSFNHGKHMVAGGGGLLLTDSGELYDRACAIDLTVPDRRAMVRQLGQLITHHTLKSMAAPLLAARRRLGRRQARPASELYATPCGSVALEAASPLNVVLATRQMSALPTIVARHRRHAEVLTGMLAGIDQIGLPGGTSRESVYVCYPISVRQGLRDRLAMFLRSKGVETKWSYFPLHLQPAHADRRRGDLSNTERLWPRLLYLPIDASLSESTVRLVGTLVQRFFRSAG